MGETTRQTKDAGNKAQYLVSLHELDPDTVAKEIVFQPLLGFRSVRLQKRRKGGWQGARLDEALQITDRARNHSHRLSDNRTCPFPPK